MDNIKKNHAELRNDIISSFNEKIKEEIIGNIGYSKIHSTLDELLDYIYWNSKPMSLELIPIIDLNKRRLGFNIKNEVDSHREIKKVDAFFWVFDDGIWGYDIKVDVFSKSSSEKIGFCAYFYEGKGNEYMVDNSVAKYFHYVDSDILDLLAVSEEYSKEYSPMYKVKDGYRTMCDNVVLGWSTSYYDGPLAGFCYQNNRMFYYSLVEEKDYSGSRLFAMYPLSIMENFKVKICRYSWFKVMNKSMLGFIFNKIFNDFRYTKEYFKNRNIKGYFEY